MYVCPSVPQTSLCTYKPALDTSYTVYHQYIGHSRPLASVCPGLQHLKSIDVVTYLQDGA